MPGVRGSEQHHKLGSHNIVGHLRPKPKVCHLKASVHGDDSVTSDEVLSSQNIQTDGQTRPNMTLLELLIPQNSPPIIGKRIGDLDDVTHGVGYETHLDPHYYQRRDMGRYYDCAKQGPWKPIPGYSVHRHPEGAADESGDHPQLPVDHPQLPVHHSQPPVHHHPQPPVHHHPLPPVHHHPQPPVHHHPQLQIHHHPQPGPNKPKGFGKFREEWDEEPQEIIHGQLPPPLIRPITVGSPPVIRPPAVGSPVHGPPVAPPPIVKLPIYNPPAAAPPAVSYSNTNIGGGIRNLPPWRGKGGGGRGIHQGGVIHHQRPSGGGQPTQQVVYHVNGHQEAPLYHVHVRKPAPSVFGDDEWHHWFYSEVSGPIEGEESHQDHEDLSAFHEAEEHVGSGGYPEGNDNAMADESTEQEEEEEGGYPGSFRGHSSAEQGDYSGEDEQTGSREEGSKEQPAKVEGGQTDEEKYPCEEEEEEKVAPANEGSASEDKDLSYLEIMYPPPLPQPTQVITAPALTDNPHESQSEEPDDVPHSYVSVQQSFAYDSPPPKCPYADHDHAYDPSVHVHQNPSQEILPPKQELRDTRGTYPPPQPMQQYEVYETNEDAGNDEGVIIRQPHTQQTSHSEDIDPDLVFGQRIPPKKPVQKFYGKPGVAPALQNSLIETANYPEEQKVGNSELRPPPMLLRDSFPKINGMKVLLDARRKRRPAMWQGGTSVRQPVKMPMQMVLRPRRIPRRPTARMTVKLP